MISMKSKFKVLYPAMLMEGVLAVGLGYLSTLVQVPIFKLVCEDVSFILFIVSYLQVLIILFSFNRKEKSGFRQLMTSTFEEVFRITTPRSYKRAIALDKKKEENGL